MPNVLGSKAPKIWYCANGFGEARSEIVQKPLKGLTTHCAFDAFQQLLNGPLQNESKLKLGELALRMYVEPLKAAKLHLKSGWAEMP